MTPADVLRAAKARIADPARWTNSPAFALDKYGGAIRPRDPDAVCWCALGSLEAEFEDVAVYFSTLLFLIHSASGLFHSTPLHVNSHHSHADVMRMFDRAIELAEAANGK